MKKLTVLEKFEKVRNRKNLEDFLVELPSKDLIEIIIALNEKKPEAVKKVTEPVKSITLNEEDYNLLLTYIKPKTKRNRK